MNPRKLAFGIAAGLAFCLAIPARGQIAGFGGTGVNWSLNNDPTSHSVPSIANNVLLLGTTKDDATSAFYGTPQFIGNFTASFVWQNAYATDQSGFVFAMQNEGTNAVGLVGGNYLGYVGINLASGIAFNVNNGNGGQPGLGYAPTQVPGGGANGYIATGAVNFHATNPIAVAISYASDVLNIAVTDTVTGANFSTNIVADLTAAVGGSTAFVGFTGGGTEVLNVSISSFVFTPAAQPVTPTSFPAVLTTGTNLDVTKLSGNESDGVIAYNPLNPSQLFIVANTNVEAGLFAVTCTNGMSGTNITNIAVGSLTPVSLANLPNGEYPSVAWDGYGNLFVAYANSPYPGIFSGINVAVSTNGGKNFALVTNLAAGHSALEPRIAVGPGPSAAGIGTNAGSVWVLYKDYSLVYAPLVAQGAAVARTNALGTNVMGTNAVGAFGLAEIIPGSSNDCGMGDIVIGPQGQVMVAYQNLFNSSGTANCFVSVNPNGLGTGAFASPVEAAANAIGGNTIIPASPDGQGINAAAGLAWDINPASEQYGRIYLVCVGQGSSNPNDTDIFLTTSTDSGASWSAQQEVNDDGGQNSKFLPRVAVDPTSGAVALSWYDCRNDTGAPVMSNSVVITIVTNDPTDTPPTSFTTNYTTNTVSTPSPTTNQAAMIYATVSLNGGVSFQPNVKVTSDSTTGYVASTAGSQTDFGDYTGLAFYGGTFYPVWADNTGKAPNPNSPSNSLDVIMAPVTLSGLADVSIKSVVVNPTNYALPQTNLLQIGSAVDYLLTVSNNGPSAVSAAYVTNIFPTNVSVYLAFPTNTNNAIPKSSVTHGNTLIWPVGQLPVKGSATILVETWAVGIGNSTNYAMITPGTGVADILTNNNATNMVTIISGANLVLSITNSPSQIGYGAPQVVYTVTVTNEGPVAASGVLISNVLSSNLVLVGVSLPVGDTYTINPSQNSVTFNIDTMTNGQMVTVSLTNYASTNFASAGPASAVCSSIVLGLINPTTTNISAQSVVPIVTPNLAIGMTGTPAIIAVGDTATYTLYVTNLGPVPAYDVVVTNALPPNLQFVSAAVRKGSYTTAPDLVVPGQTDITIVFSQPLQVGQGTEAIITATAVSLGSAGNVVVVGDVTVDLNPANNTVQVVTPVLPPDLALGMTASPAYIAVGDTVTYTLRVTNLGPVIAHGIVVTNALPPSLQLAGVSVRKGTSTTHADTVVFGQTDITAAFSQPLPVGENTEVIITATALSLGQATNVAYVYDSVLDPNLANNTARVVTPVLSAEIVVGMTGSTNYLPVGDSITYTIIVTNWGPVNGHSVLVTNVLPTNFVLTAATVSTGSYTTGPDPIVAGATDIIASLGTMATGQTATMTVTATATGLGNATNVSVVYDNEVDPNLVNNTARVVTSVLAPNLVVGMTGTPSSITVGDTVTFNISVTNLGPVIARSVVVSNTLPTNLTFVSAGPNITFTQSQNVVVFQIGTMTNGQIVLMDFTAISTGLGYATTTAVVSDSQPDTNVDYATAQVVTTVVAPDVALGMTASPSTVGIGQNITYTLYVTNLGPPAALSAAVTNTLPSNVSFEGTTVPMGVTYYVTNQNQIIFNFGTMTNGQTDTLSILALAASVGEATNAAVAGDSLEDNDAGNNMASAVTTITNAETPFVNLAVVPGVTGVFVTWNSPSNSSSQVFYGLTASGANYTTNFSWLNPVSTNYHVVLLTGLVPDTNYYFQAVSIVPAVPGSYTTNGTVVTYSGGTAAVTNTTNGTFSTTSTVVMQTTDAAYSGPGWSPSGLGNGIFSYNNAYLYYSVRGVMGAPTASATFTPDIPVAGLYDVSVWYPIPATGNTNFSANTPMSANSSTNQVSVNINQTINGGSWQPLTTALFYATNGYLGNLVINNNSGDPTTSVVANGARWAYELSQDAPTNGSVPAWWANFYFTNSLDPSASGTNDFNGDGNSNFTKYVLGTDPLDLSLELQFTVTPGPSNVIVGFAPFMGGRVYQLLATTNLMTPVWVTLTNAAAQNTNDGSGFFTIPPGEPGTPGYYRLSATLSTNQ